MCIVLINNDVKKFGNWPTSVWNSQQTFLNSLIFWLWTFYKLLKHSLGRWLKQKEIKSNSAVTRKLPSSMTTALHKLCTKYRVSQEIKSLIDDRRRRYAFCMRIIHRKYIDSAKGKVKSLVCLVEIKFPLYRKNVNTFFNIQFNLKKI